MEIRGKTAVVTGGAQGIGKALAARLLRGGARVALWDLKPDLLEAARAELAPVGDVSVHAVDVSDPAAVADAARRVERALGPVDILDNNAAVVYGADFLSCTDEQLRRTMAVNVDAVMWCTRAFLPGMIARGQGRIVMMASAAGLVGTPGMAAYSASKHAVIGLAESLRLELRNQGHSGVKLLVVCPSFVKTGMFDGAAPPKLVPWLEPEALADAVYDALLKDKPYLLEPFLVKLLPAFKGFMSAGLLDWFSDLLGASAAMKGWKGRRP